MNHIIKLNKNKYIRPNLIEPSLLPIKENLKQSIIWKKGFKKLIFWKISGSLLIE